MHVCISMHLSKWLISVSVSFLHLYIGAHATGKNGSGDADATDNQEQPLNAVWIAGILFWKAKKGIPDAVGVFLGTDHVMSVYHTPWTGLFPLKPFDTSDVPPFTGWRRNDGLLPSLFHAVWFFFCAFWGCGDGDSNHTIRYVFITKALHDLPFFFFEYI